jgi:hypothetical protein
MSRSLTLREESWLRVLENRVLRRIFGPKRDKVTRNRENYIMRRLLICTLHPILFCDKIKKNEMSGPWSAYGRKERRIQGFGGETCRKETTWKTQA